VTQKLNWSARASHGVPAACSGAMYAGVPTIAPERVTLVTSTLSPSMIAPGADTRSGAMPVGSINPSERRASPKSVTRTEPR
jgi:hypothetical protein